ncbi:unnamed protein product, partial [marine sediment metagenome]
NLFIPGIRTTVRNFGLRWIGWWGMQIKNYNLRGRVRSRDNIAEWNEKHPDEKFSLIEITPMSLVERKWFIIF